jgi:hypothetical protein
VGVRCYSHWRQDARVSPDRRSLSVPDDTGLPVPAATSVSYQNVCKVVHACMLISLILLHGDEAHSVTRITVHVNVDIRLNQASLTVCVPNGTSD